MENNKKKILIIEDDQVILDMYSVKFKESNYNVFTASLGLDGLKIAKKEKPEIILLDVMMPQMDGYTVLRKLKEDKSTKNIPVILLTNLAQSEDREKGKKLGALDYLVKANFTPSQIEEKVSQVLEKVGKR